MPDFVTLSCPSCSGKLEITNDVDRFACAHCGNEHVVRRSGGIVSLTRAIEGLKQVQAGVDKTASELAIQRLEREINDLADEAMRERHRITAMFDDMGIIGTVLRIMGREKSQREATIQPYRDAIQEKQRELEKHRKIVSG